MLKTFVKILLTGWTSILMACQTIPACPAMPTAPVKPTLESITQNQDRGMCLNEEDTKKLATYLLELENGYK